MLELNEFDNPPELENINFDEAEKELQERLYILFSEASKQNLGVIILLEGVSASGKGDLLKCITTRLDPRKVKVYSMEEGDLENESYPFMHHFWSKLPGFNEQIILDGSWYSKFSFQKQNKILKKNSIPNIFKFIKNFEETISSDKYIFLKFFLNISAKEQKKRLKKAMDEGKKWMVSKSDWEQYEQFYDYKKLHEEYLNKTNFPFATWKIVPAKNKFYTKITVMESIIDCLEKKLKLNSREVLEVLLENEKQVS